MDHTNSSQLREIIDRHEIYDCIMRYCRGIDRFDRDVVRSAYHPDALDDHGAYVGPVEGFIDWAFGWHAQFQHRTQHIIGNHRCELAGDVAHTESYYIFRSLNTSEPLTMTVSGRYIDRLEKRSGRWGIVARVCTVEVPDMANDPGEQPSESPFLATSRARDDISYQRPLTIDPRRFTN